MQIRDTQNKEHVDCAARSAVENFPESAIFIDEFVEIAGVLEVAGELTFGRTMAILGAISKFGYPNERTK